MSSVYIMKGVQDLIEVFDDKVTITPKGILGFMNKGLKGTKTIPYSSITAIQFKKAGFAFSGYIQFTIPGGNENKGGFFAAASDENMFMFAKKKNNQLAITIQNYIESKIKTGINSNSSKLTSNISDEILKLSKLKEQGLLSNEEFMKAKNKLIA